MLVRIWPGGEARVPPGCAPYVGDAPESPASSKSGVTERPSESERLLVRGMSMKQFSGPVSVGVLEKERMKLAGRVEQG